MANKLYIWSWAVCLYKWSSFNHFTDIRTGVPQGSILGPLLIILNINDIVNVSKDAELLLFADDTNVFLYDTDIYQVYQLSVRANKALSDINNCLKLNKLSVNVNKCNLYYSLLDQLGLQLIVK